MIHKVRFVEKIMETAYFVDNVLKSITIWFKRQVNL